MRPANNAGRVGGPKNVEETSLKELKSLRDDTWKLSVFHRTSENSSAGIIMEGVSSLAQCFLSVLQEAARGWKPV